MNYLDSYSTYVISSYVISDQTNYPISDLIIITFVVTALWDIVLRKMSENFESLPLTIQKSMPFMKDLKPYFQQHTLLAAALIAGFVGALTQPIILQFTSLQDKNILKILIITFTVSALYGFIMKASKLFPYLEEHYYNKLGVVRSMYHDGISGVIVQITIIILLKLITK